MRIRQITMIKQHGTTWVDRWSGNRNNGREQTMDHQYRRELWVINRLPASSISCRADRDGVC